MLGAAPADGVSNASVRAVAAGVAGRSGSTSFQCAPTRDHLSKNTQFSNILHPDIS